MNTKHLHLIYGLALVIVIPLAAWLFLASRDLAAENREQSEKLVEVENKLSRLEKFYREKRKEMILEEGREATPSAQKQTPKETPAPEGEKGVQSEEINKKQYSIRVLNAKGVQGVAAAARDILEEKGYYVADIDNARWQLESTIKVKKGLEKVAEQIKEDLKGEYTFVSVEELEPGSDYDIVIYIGSK